MEVENVMALTSTDSARKARLGRLEKRRRGRRDWQARASWLYESEQTLVSSGDYELGDCSPLDHEFWHAGTDQQVWRGSQTPHMSENDIFSFLETAFRTGGASCASLIAGLVTSECYSSSHFFLPSGLIDRHKLGHLSVLCLKPFQFSSSFPNSYRCSLLWVREPAGTHSLEPDLHLFPVLRLGFTLVDDISQDVSVYIVEIGKHCKLRL